MFGVIAGYHLTDLGLSSLNTSNCARTWLFSTWVGKRVEAGSSCTQNLRQVSCPKSLGLLDGVGLE